MLNKIGVFTWAASILATALIGYCDPRVDSALSHFKIQVKIFSLDIPVLYAVPGTIIGVLARAVRLHNWLAKLFRVRENFDLYRILVPLADAVGSTITVTELASSRDIAMKKTFYPYASFDEPKISKALVLSSIDAWCWYWILLELAFILAITSVVLMCTGSFEAACFTLLGFSSVTLFFPTLFRVCGRKAGYQIEEIVSDSDRAASIRREFNALAQTHDS